MNHHQRQCGIFGPAPIVPGLDIGLAVSSSLLYSTNDSLCYTVIATADADTVITLTFPIGGWAGGGIPAGANLDVTITPIVQATAALSLWALTTQANGTCVLTKATTAGSGGAGAQIQVYVRRKR